MSDVEKHESKLTVNDYTDEELSLLVEDAEKWRSWTKGEYRLICNEKYTQLAEAHKTLQQQKKQG